MESNANALDASLARQRAGVSPRNAYWLARLSDMAYDGEDALKKDLAGLAQRHALMLLWPARNASSKVAARRTRARGG